MSGQWDGPHEEEWQDVGQVPDFDGGDGGGVGVGGVPSSPEGLSSPVTRGKVRKDGDQKKAAAAPKTATKKRKAADKERGKGKGRSVVARLSSGRGTRSGVKGKGAAEAPRTPGPPRTREGPRFVEMSEVSSE